jgi:hypothetical protein
MTGINKFFYTKEQQFCSARSNGCRDTENCVSASTNEDDVPESADYSGGTYVPFPAGVNLLQPADGESGCPVDSCCKPGCLGIAFDGACSAATSNSYSTVYDKPEFFGDSHIRADHTCKVSTEDGVFAHQTNKRLETLYDMVYDHTYASESGRSTIETNLVVDMTIETDMRHTIHLDPEEIVQPAPHLLTVGRNIEFNGFTDGHSVYGEDNLCTSRSKEIGLQMQENVNISTYENNIYPLSQTTHSIHHQHLARTISATQKTVTYDSLYWGGGGSGPMASAKIGPGDPGKLYSFLYTMAESSLKLLRAQTR